MAPFSFLQITPERCIGSSLTQLLMGLSFCAHIPKSPMISRFLKLRTTMFYRGAMPREKNSSGFVPIENGNPGSIIRCGRKSAGSVSPTTGSDRFPRMRRSIRESLALTFVALIGSSTVAHGRGITEGAAREQNSTRSWDLERYPQRGQEQILGDPQKKAMIVGDRNAEAGKWPWMVSCFQLFVKPLFGNSA